jgi:hypothetical protein
MIGMFTATIFYQSGMRTGKTLILLGCVANFLAITLRYGLVDINFWNWFGLGFVFGLVLMFRERHTIQAQFEECWNNISEFWLGEPEKEDDE